MKMKSRKGSALLIVLGMLAIMIASAVGFAVYMRSSRLPSSYLRRSSSSRQLVKAALARAIDVLDRSIANDPHPGVGVRPSNVWRDRVFVGAAGCTNGMADAVSPLCLEALAYVPPPLVDPLRYYSRLTDTARWHSLGFDAGRYSWVAVDVSDYFDVNRLLADAPRTSAANRRISLAYLCEDENHRGDKFASEWDSFMEKYRGKPDEATMDFDFSGRYPFISLADFNLALGAKGKVGEFYSPFCEFLDGAMATFGSTGSDRGDEYLSRMTFVTDGLFPSGSGTAKTATGATVYDLANPKYQPFRPEDLDTAQGNAPSYAAFFTGDLMTKVSNYQDWRDRLGVIGSIALFDYLDTDHRPVSLALPVVERVPMICAVEPHMQGGKIAVAKTFEPAGERDSDIEIVSESKTSRQVRKTVIYKLDGTGLMQALGAGCVRTVVAFPFAHKDASDGTFSLDGRFTLFFSTAQMGLRTNNADDLLHLSSKSLGSSGMDDNGLMNIVLDKTSIPAFKNIKADTDAVEKVDCMFKSGAKSVVDALSSDKGELLRVTYTWTQSPRVVGGVINGWTPAFSEVWQNPGSGGVTIEAKSQFKALKADGTLDKEELSEGKLAEYLKKGIAEGPELRLNAAVWLRVSDGEDVVDMVPACLRDDAVQNGANLGPLGRGSGNDMEAKPCGMPYPLMRFDTGINLRLSVENLNNLAGAGAEIAIAPTAAMVADPRFNHAPEQWFRWGGSVTPETWLANNHANSDDRDGDIFMATSDAGYMQSVYELAMLTEFSNLSGVDDTHIASLESLNRTDISSFPDSFGAALNQHFAWRTYDPMDLHREAFENFPRTSEGTGFKINPYSDSTNVIMAAFANTPFDWAHSSTNVVEGESWDPSQKASEFNKKYAFNEYNPDAKITWDDLSQIARNFSVAARGGSNWKTAWNSLDWWGENSDFCGVNLSGDTAELWAVDRKFLYGFWKDCFAAKQQMFLVFVRAEPTMMGGSGASQLPPQLGARAVALVWRDPTAARDETLPHQTRVLFYRQFE